MDLGDDEEGLHGKRGCKRRPLYTVRQPPLIQPLRVSAFTQKTYSGLGLPEEDLAHEWVVLFKAISGGKMGECMPLQIPDTVLLSPSGQPSVWYTTSSSGRVTEKDLMRVSPQAICEAFQTPQSQQHFVCAAATTDFAAVRRLGFRVDTLSSHQLKMLCTDMEHPDICLPFELPSTTSTSTPVRSGLSKGVFCLQRHIPHQTNSTFLIVWRNSPVVSSSEQPKSTCKTTEPATEDTDRGVYPTVQAKVTSSRHSRRAHSDVFLLTQVEPDCTHDAKDGNVREETRASQISQKEACRLAYLDIEHHRDDHGSTTWKLLRQGGFDPDVMAPLLFYMKRVTSEIANSINLGRNTRQACGLVCEFFIGEHNRRVYFSGLCGIQWVASAPSWERLRDADSLSRSLCEFYESPTYYQDDFKRVSSPLRPRSPIASAKSAFYEQNPRFPSVHTPFADDKQWLHRSQLLAPDISPRYIGASVPKICRAGVFQSLLTAHQAASVVRLNFSPRAPSTLTEVRREQPHMSSRKISLRQKTTNILVTSSKGV